MQKLQGFEALLNKRSPLNIHQASIYNKFKPGERKTIIELLKTKIGLTIPDFEDPNLFIGTNK